MQIELSAGELQKFSQIQLAHSLGVLALDWALIFAALILATRSTQPFVWLLAVLIVVRQQHGLAVLMHEASHTRLTPSIRWNERLGHWLCSAPLLFSLPTYRYLHLLHHKGPMAETDPDLSVTGGYPKARKDFIRKLKRDFTGRTYHKFIRFYTAVPPRQRSGEGWWAKRPLTSCILMNSILLAVFTWVGGPFAYLGLWIFPLFFVLPAILRVRAISEHAGFGPSADQSLNSRTFTPSWQTLVMAPHNVNYHIEHHLYPSVPFSRLPALQKHLDQRRGRPRENLFCSYFQVLGSLLGRSGP